MKAAIDDVMSGAFARRGAAMSFTDYLAVVGEPDWAQLQEKYGSTLTRARHIGAYACVTLDIASRIIASLRASARC